jgi:hypothetical protein
MYIDAADVGVHDLGLTFPPPALVARDGTRHLLGSLGMTPAS